MRPSKSHPDTEYRESWDTPSMKSIADISTAHESLQEFRLPRLLFHPEDWREIIQTFDLSAPKTLGLAYTNLFVDELRLLVNRITEWFTDFSGVLGYFTYDPL
ncbi:hypothetical protein BC939DRAFT_504013 [Gamsiella multidivaricata]|uniref:uncharacterized protein n=1 Tax=Gamsiella multidivaricata TaxID=101098 RepID=UPI00221EC524|nr:uncharacterized protein BC939DRAFT_504013 [Gamsiella multidivaricata]KAI7821962.1 hypothetical protein BC939DRAFT_504013 [Gamsiella multidivaricata]